MSQNVRVAKLLTIAGASVLAVVLAAVGVDTGAAIYAEYQLSRNLRSATGLPLAIMMFSSAYPPASGAGSTPGMS